MDFLLAAPIPIRAVFFTKLLQAILPNFAFICAFALPVLYGLGASQGYSILYYPFVLILLVTLALAAAGISSLLVMLAARIFPARRMVEVLGFLGAIISFVCSQSGQLAQYNEFSPEQAGQAFQLVSRFNIPWSPLTWAGDGLSMIGQGQWAGGLLRLMLTTVLAVGVFSVTLATAERLYYTGWASMQGQKRKKKSVRSTSKRPGHNPLTILAERYIPSALRAIIYKDFLMLQRDLRNLSQLITPLIFGVIYSFIFLRDGGELPTGRGDAPEIVLATISNLSVYFNVGISLFVGWMLLSRLGGMGFSQEGKNFWMLKTAPISTRTLMSAKFLVAYLPVLTLSWLFLAIISLLQGNSIAVLGFSLIVVALCLAGSAGLALYFGVMGAKLDWDDPRQMQRTGSGCLGSLATMLYLPLSLLLFFAPTLLMQILDYPQWIGQALGFLLGGAFSLTCAILPLWLARHKLQNLGEN